MKQAVVFIHGIGEQKPMDTLRRFVSAVLPPAKPGREQYWNKPDPMAELFELRRLQKVGRPGTHFYEYYWAYHIEGTQLTHLLEWIWGLIRRPRIEIPKTLRGVWWVSRLLIGLLAITTMLGGVGHVLDWYDKLPASGFIWLAITGVLSLLQYLLVYYLGDAARYLSPQPSNIDLRQKIRAEGIQLLRKLHESGKYDRIIVVGHSLGSVIGYDIITRLWQEYNEIYTGFTPNNQALYDLLDNGQAPQPMLRDELPDAGKNLCENAPDAFERWRKCQRNAWIEQRFWGNPWRISDFVTLGSPLAHAMLLLANSEDDFAQRKRQRELPTCPPQRDTNGYGYAADTTYAIQDKKFKPLYLHHAAPFAVTRWTNLYFPVYGGLGGDFIGGPLRPVLGLGIKDVPVQNPALGALRNRSPLAHTTYWHQVLADVATSVSQSETSSATDQHLEPTLAALNKALNLRELRKYHVPDHGETSTVDKDAGGATDQDTDYNDEDEVVKDNEPAPA